MPGLERKRGHRRGDVAPLMSSVAIATTRTNVFTLTLAGWNAALEGYWGPPIDSFSCYSSPEKSPCGRHRKSLAPGVAVGPLLSRGTFDIRIYPVASRRACSVCFVGPPPPTTCSSTGKRRQEDKAQGDERSRSGAARGAGATPSSVPPPPLGGDHKLLSPEPGRQRSDSPTGGR